MARLAGAYFLIDVTFTMNAIPDYTSYNENLDWRRRLVSGEIVIGARALNIFFIGTYFDDDVERPFFYGGAIDRGLIY